MTTAIGLFLANFSYIFLKAFQQKNVMKDNYVLVLPTSFGMAACEYFIMGTIALVAVGDSSWNEAMLNVLCIGLGGGLGSLIGMVAHNKMSSRGTVSGTQ